MSFPVAEPVVAPDDLLQRILMPEVCSKQAPLHVALRPREALGVVVGSLAVGGAERIVLDWADQNQHRYDIHLCVLHRMDQEWPIPAGLVVTRLDGQDISAGLEAFALTLCRVNASAAAGATPRVLCHMTRSEHRQALEAGGVHAIAVLHNALAGWKEPVGALADNRRVVAVSQACVDDLASVHRTSDVSLIRHLPKRRALTDAARRDLRLRVSQTLALPLEEGGRAVKLVAMVGGIKPQKNYVKAISVLAALSGEPTHLVIFGGPIGAEGRQSLLALREAIVSQGLQDRVRLAGFVPEAAQYLPAFDVLVNTSHYEGLSIATLEALAAQVPVVAAQVGGQGEVPAAGLTLMPALASVAEWGAAVRQAWASKPALPTWVGFPAHRLWSLEHLAAEFEPRDHVLFATANLNSGGAQRSLVNLACALQSTLSLEIAVTGLSSSDWFLQTLRNAGVLVSRTADTKDCFDHAEALLRIVAHSRAKVVCFWNVDPKVKLLVTKALTTTVRVVDVSPGGYAFEEMTATKAFQDLVGFSEAQYYQRLARLVLKYDTDVPAGIDSPRTVVRNGVALAAPRAHRSAHPRIVLNGRIAPTKFLVEIVQAMHLVWMRWPKVELHVLGGAEPRNRVYAQDFLAALEAAAERTQRRGSPVPQVTLHGALHELACVAQPGDIAVVLGHHQGCPNAALEALAHGMVLVANDSGGTSEIVQNGQTGVLLQSTEPQELADALAALLSDDATRTRLARQGRSFVEQEFSMSTMTRGYAAVFQSLFQR